MAFVDYEKAFNSVQISAVLDAIRKQGVEEIYCRLLEDIYIERDGTATIKIHAETNKIPNTETVYSLLGGCIQQVRLKGERD